MSGWYRLRKGVGDFPEEAMDVVVVPIQAIIPDLAGMSKTDVAHALVNLVDQGFLDLHFKTGARLMTIRMRMKAPGLKPDRWKYIEVPLVTYN